jgi:hypothetical protein
MSLSIASSFEVTRPVSCLAHTEQVFRREGELWTISYDGQTVWLNDVRGAHYVAHLLRHPHREFLAVELVQLHAGGGGEFSPARRLAGESVAVLDDTAKAAYRRRLAETRDELEEAHAFNDLGRVRRLQHELEWLTSELKRAVGLHGRAARTGSMIERARANVGRAIAAVRQRIAAVHLPLGSHLDHTIKTGTFCVYAPDPRVTVTWEL